MVQLALPHLPEPVVVGQAVKHHSPACIRPAEKTLIKLEMMIKQQTFHLAEALVQPCPELPACLVCHCGTQHYCQPCLIVAFNQFYEYLKVLFYLTLTFEQD